MIGVIRRGKGAYGDANILGKSYVTGCQILPASRDAGCLRLHDIGALANVRFLRTAAG